MHSSTGHVSQLTSSFRFDINGLRAWAVVAVILYHFGVPGFGGGFIGVDVFFVISGYLMTGIVVRGLERGSFSLLDFYLARGRRIIPTLAVLCLTLLALGWFFLLPPDYRQLSTHSGYSLAFLSNIEYFREAGYFDSASHEKWLLHTWSLSVEWQFYIVLPLVLWAAWKIRPGRTTQAWVVGAGFLASYAASIVVTRQDPSAAFFLLHTRAWEMLGGGLVLLLGQAWQPGAQVRRVLEGTGLLLIALSVALLDKQAVWPGSLALVPVAAAMLVIQAGQPSFLTGNRLAQWLGDRSYSLYLWHWPVCVALVYAEVQREPLAIGVGLALTLLLGHASYKLVEVPARVLFGGARLRTAAALALAMLVTVGPAVYVRQMAGVAGRFPAEVDLAAAQAGDQHPRRGQCHASSGTTSPSCRFGSAQPVTTAILVGDSHASVLVSALAQAAHKANGAVVLHSYSGCPYLPDMEMQESFLRNLPRTYQCSQFNNWVQARIAAAPPGTPVVMVARYAQAALGMNEVVYDAPVSPPAYFSRPYASATPAYLREFGGHIVAAACEAARGGRRVFLVRPIPEMGVDVPKAASRRLSLGKDGAVSIPLADYRARNGWVWQAQDEAVRQCGVKVIDATAPLCRDGRCHGTEGGVPVYFDDDHLSERGNALLAPLFDEVFAAPE